MFDNGLVPDEPAKQKITRLLNEEIGRLIAEIEHKQKELAKAQETLKTFTASDSAASSASDGLPLVRPGQYNGLPISWALDSYLRERNLQPVPVEKAAADLLKGGVFPGEPRKKNKDDDPLTLMLHNLRITMKNRKTFNWDKANGLVSLSANAAVPKRRNRKGS